MNLLCVANIRKNKGQEFLIDALRRLNRKDVKLHLVGSIKEKSYYDHLLENISRAGLKDNVFFPGFLGEDRLRSAYSEADIFILPTLKEGFGMVLVEAMSFGLPIIASRVGGIPEIIDDAICGLLVPPASPEELAKEIGRLLKDKKLREYLGSNALKKYQSMPSWQESFESMMRFLYGNLGVKK